jgi:phosphoribosylglycinamide formyltransferase-1
VGTVLLEKWEGRMINLHPSLLPLFPGIDAIGQAWRAGVKETGVTVHFVDAGMDTGQLFLQQKVTVDPEDTVESLAAKIHLLEHQLLPKAILKFQQEM